MGWNKVNRNWFHETNSNINKALVENHLEVAKQITGGKAGVILKCSTAEGKNIILKAMPTEASVGQISALKSENKYYPKLLTEERGGVFLMEYYPGEPWTNSNGRIDAKEMAEILYSVANSKLNDNTTEHSVNFLGRALMNMDTIPSSLKAHLPYINQLVEKTPQDELFHSHGDMGVHNLYVTNSNKLMVLDPSGTVALMEYDAGCLAVWSGTGKDQTENIARDISKGANLDFREVIRWAIFRVFLSALFGHTRRNVVQHEECLNTFLLLKNRYEF